MTPNQARGALRRQISLHGETVSLVRGYGGGSPVTVAGVRARVTGFQAEDLAGGVSHGERRVILLAEDLAATALPTPAKGDRVLWNGKSLNVVAVDDASRRIAGVLVGYELRVAGA